MIEQMQDKSEEWLEWRRKGIGSSDAPIIMGVSDYATPYELWLEKTGKSKRDNTTNFIQDKGNRAEAFIRARIELETGLEYPPQQCEHYQDRFLRASLDGREKIEGHCPERQLLLGYDNLSTRSDCL